LCRICFGHHPSSSVFAHLQLSRLWYWRTNASNRCRLRIPLFDSSLCDGFLTHVLIQSFFQQIPVTAFTTTSFTWWPGATKLIYVAVQPFSPSACPNWVRLCRICLFGFRLVRAGFGYAETPFRLSACPNLAFRRVDFILQPKTATFRPTFG